MIDWELATATAQRLTPSGPRLARADAQEAVTALRAASARATDLVTQTAQLEAPPGPAALVVDRATWVQANVESFKHLFDPVVTGLIAGGDRRPAAWAQSVGARATGVEIGALMAFLSARVLGQYEPAIGRQAQAAQLLLVAPNIVATETRLSLAPNDFRLWVCLHEHTHRAQFSAVPWLREHVLGLQQQLVAEVSAQVANLGDVLAAVTQRAPRALSAHGMGVGELVLDSTTRARLLRLTAIMALLEGHADVVMDAVGDTHIPTVATIRARFDTRHEALSVMDRFTRRLLGVEAKMAQYRDGAAFVREVQRHVGIEGFNRVWADPQALPQADELLEPMRWLERVHR